MPRLNRLPLHLGLVVALTALFISSETLAADEESSKRPPVTRTLPVPRDVQDAMQSRRYADAVKLIESKLQDDSSSSIDYLMYLKGLALMNSGEADSALSAFNQLEKDHPKSPWISRSRFGRAAVAVSNRDYDKAGAIYRAEAERLLSDDRRDELAKIYLEFADRYYQGIPQKDPSAKPTPDYEQALQYYREAKLLRPSIDRQQTIDFQIARCQQELGQLDPAAEAYRAFLSDYGASNPESGTTANTELRCEATWQLGKTELQSGRPAAARRTWGRMFSDFESASRDSVSIADLVAQARYQMSHTYGIPSPATIGDMELGITLAERFLKDFPDHELAPKAELEIAQSYQRHRRNLQAVQRLEEMIANPRYKDSEELAQARQLLGQAQLAQQNFDDAILAWKSFLDNHPTDPQWPVVQQQIVSAEYAAAEHAYREKDFDQARKKWQTFLNKYPLDDRSPQILYLFGAMNFERGQQKLREKNEAPSRPDQTPNAAKSTAETTEVFESAIADWKRLVTKYPSSGQASLAAFRIGVTLEEQLDRKPAALDAYRAVKGVRETAAAERIARLTRPELKLFTKRKFRSNEKASIQLTTRNLQTVNVAIYPIDMTDYFRKMHLASGVENLDIALIDPDQQFSHTVENYEDYKQIEQGIEIPTDGPGVTAITVSSDKLEATTMLVVSDLDIIVKSSRNELFLFAQNMVSDQPAQDVKILLSDGSEVFGDGETGEDGVFRLATETLREAKDLRVFAHQDGNTASTVTNLNGLDFAVGLAPKGIVFTDRPVYRPGELVNIKGVVRWVDNDQYTFQTGESFQLDIYDARGRKIKGQKVSLNGFGTIHTNLVIPKSTPSGRCRIHLHRASSTGAGRLSFESNFDVQPFRLEPVRLEVTTDEDVFFRGDEIQAKVSLRYYYGAPVANEEVVYSIGGDDETRKGKTDERGELSVSFKTERFSESQPLAIQVQCPQRNVNASHVVFLATRGFNVQVGTVRDVFIAGESFESTITLTSPSGSPVSEKLKLQVFAVTRRIGAASNRQTGIGGGLGGLGERLVSSFDLQTDPESGEARKSLRIEDGGQFIIRATGEDQFGNKVSGQTRVQISDDSDPTRLRVLADKHHFRVGETADLQLHWREPSGLALVTYDGASVLGYQIVRLRKGENALRIPLTANLAPNFYLSATVMDDHKFHQAGTDLSVANELTVKLTPSETETKPETALKVDVQVTDASGKGVAAELAVGLVQSSVWERFGEGNRHLVQGFRSNPRQRRMRQASSCVFQYSPKTQAINDALIAESERLLLENAEAASRDMLADGRVLFGGAVNSDAGLNDASGIENFSDENWDQANLPASGRPGYAGGAEWGAGGFAGQSRGLTGDFAAPQVAQQYSIPQPPLATPYYALGDQFDNLQVKQQLQRVELQSTLGRNQTRTYYDRRTQPSLSKRLSFGRTSDRFGFSNQNLATYDTQRSALPQSVWYSNADTSGKMMHTIRSTNEGAILNALTPNGRLTVVNAATNRQALASASEQGTRMMGIAVTGETGFWDPIITTKDNGTASFEIPLPSTSTAWQVHASAITANAEAGADSVEVITRNPIFAKVRLPQAFTVGDQPIVPVEVHCITDEPKQLEVTLKVSMGKEVFERKEVLEVKQSGVQRLQFPASITSTELVNIQVSVSEAGKVVDTQMREIPVLPYGVSVFRSASGTAAQNTVALLGFPQSDKIRPNTLSILVGGNINESLLDSMLGGQSLLPLRCIATSQVERSASDCLAGVALLEGLRKSNQNGSPQVAQIEEILASAISNLVTSQRDDGGWSLTGTSGGESDAMLTSRVVWGLGAARDAGFPVPQKQIQQAVTRLKSDFGKQNDLNRQSVILAALSEVGAGDFALANRLYRERNRLNGLGVANLMLALSALQHPEMSLELDQRFRAMESTIRTNTTATPIEIDAIRLIALQRCGGESQQRQKLAEKILSRRSGNRWQIESENGPAISALASHFEQNSGRQEAIRLTVYVNGTEIDQIDLAPGGASERLQIDPSLLVDDKQKIEFELDGRGEFTYSAVLQGFIDAEQAATTAKDWSLKRRYEPDEIRLKGKRVRRGHGIIQGSYSWKPNVLTELPVGDRGVVTLSPRVRYRNSRPLRQYLMLIEPIPSGCTILEETISGVFDRYEISPGAITFYIGDQKTPGDIRYTVAGYVEGKSKTAPAVLRSYFSPDEIAVSAPYEITILDANGQSSDEYRMTPDELFAFGKHFFAEGEYATAVKYLNDLNENWRLDPDPFKECITLLFKSSLQLNTPSETVRYFEIIKERFPDVELSFDEILKVAAAYRDIAEYERSYLVYRATIEGNFEKENQVAGFLNTQGELLRSIETMESLLRDYPAESYVATATYALAQEVYRRAPTAQSIPCLRAAKLTRIDLTDASIRMLDDFLTNWPEDPSSDQASFALATALIDLEDYDRAIERGTEYAKRFPKSRLLDSFWYMIGFCYFELQDHQKALEMCRKVAESQFTDSRTGSPREADNKWEAIYIMGQVYHSLGQAAKAIDEYTRVSDRFKDAAEAIDFFSRKAIELPDVTTIAPGDQAEVALKHRNLENAFIKVYKIDLMKFGLTRRNLDRITAINLAGIKPYHETEIEFGDGKDYADRETGIKLPLSDLGAYLVVARGANLYSSGLIVVSPLELEADEDPISGRVRVTIKDSVNSKFVPNVTVKVIGSANEDFVSGQTDLRGLFVADDIRGTSTVIAVGENDQYAFHRGAMIMQPAQVNDLEQQASQEAAQQAEQSEESAPASKAGKPLLNNLFNQNGKFQMQQKLNIDNLMNNSREGIQSKEAY